MISDKAAAGKLTKIPTIVEAAATKLKAKVMFDGRNLFQPETMKAKGWTYHSIGRMTVIG